VGDRVALGRGRRRWRRPRTRAELIEVDYEVLPAVIDLAQR
jgi:CO/xanthine dehydrogenase Mo-binding subunit